MLRKRKKKEINNFQEKKKKQMQNSFTTATVVDYARLRPEQNGNNFKVNFVA